MERNEIIDLHFKLYKQMQSIERNMKFIDLAQFAILLLLMAILLYLY